VYRKQVRRRRAAIVALIVISLMLLSLRFGEGEGGPLHGIQRGVASIFTPIEEGAERALKPVRDLVNWFDETFDARGENDDLRTELAEARSELAEAESAIGENEEFRKLLALDKEAPVAEYEPVTGRVIGRSPTVWYSTITIDKGSSSNVEVDDPVISGDGLVGRITDTTRGAAQVTLITDHRSAVSATLLPNGPSGIVEPEAGDPDDLLLDFIESDDEINEGQTLVTAGWSDGEISSAYPAGLEIGEVSEASEGETEEFQRVHIEPFADMRNLDWVQVLTGGPERPGIPTGE
jgi:rod shape-determining protein MreC